MVPSVTDVPVVEVVSVIWLGVVPKSTLKSSLLDMVVACTGVVDVFWSGVWSTSALEASLLVVACVVGVLLMSATVGLSETSSVVTAGGDVPTVLEVLVVVMGVISASVPEPLLVNPMKMQ